MKRKPDSAAKRSAKAKPDAALPAKPAGKAPAPSRSFHPPAQPAKAPGATAKRPAPAPAMAKAKPASPPPARRQVAAEKPRPEPTAPPAAIRKGTTQPVAQPKRAVVVRKPKAAVPKPGRPGAAKPVAVSPVGPAQRYALGPAPVGSQPELLGETGELPEAYGSRRLFLAARDPHWLYAHWDFTAEQLREVNALSADRRPVLRVYIDSFSVPPCCEVHVHPGSRNWFVHVGQGGTRYVAELGYYREGDRVWVGLSRSEATLTPPDVAAAEAEPEFSTIPIDVPFETLSALIQAAAKENVPLAEAILQLQAAGYEGLPGTQDWPKLDWTPEREAALAEAVSESFTLDGVRRAWVGSLEITELLRRGLLRQHGSIELVSSAGVGAIGQEIAPAPGSISSPAGLPPARRGFWFNVNAELIVYGATEPDAAVTLGGREIRLRPDGTFSFRFALPDGQYELPAVAVSADGVDRRQAALEFRRSTAYEGEVGMHPQDPTLKKPGAEAVG